MEAGSSRRRRRGADKAADRPSAANWREGLFNLSFDDDCHTGYLSLLFPAVLDGAPAITTTTTEAQGSTSATQGDAEASKDRAPPPVDERSWLAAGPSTSYGGDVTPGGSSVSGAGSLGLITRDTRPLISDDETVGEGGRESSVRIVGEVWMPFLLAGLGSVLAGLVLDLVQVGPDL